MEDKFEKIGKDASRMNTLKVYTPDLESIKWKIDYPDHNEWVLIEDNNERDAVYRIMKSNYRIQNVFYTLYIYDKTTTLAFEVINSVKKIETLQLIANILRNEKR
jgi:hypothetical protein